MNDIVYVGLPAGKSFQSASNNSKNDFLQMYSEYLRNVPSDIAYKFGVTHYIIIAYEYILTHNIGSLSTRVSEDFIVRVRSQDYVQYKLTNDHVNLNVYNDLACYMKDFRRAKSHAHNIKISTYRNIK